MTRPRRPKRVATATHVPRTARLNELLREVIAEELERIADDRLEFVTITSVDVDSDLNRAIVMFDSLDGEGGDASVLEALGALRVRLQKAIGTQITARKTPILEFRPDDVIRSANRIDEILRNLPPIREQIEPEESPYRP